MNFLEKLATATKAVIATTIIGMPALVTGLNALFAAAGIGEMPDGVELQQALVALVVALVGGLVVYQMPNATAEEVAEKKEEANDPTPDSVAQSETNTDSDEADEGVDEFGNPK
jgi:phosphoribosylcarboxyaminoimidazole (NCAIR) mutase